MVYLLLSVASSVLHVLNPWLHIVARLVRGLNCPVSPDTPLNVLRNDLHRFDLIVVYTVLLRLFSLAMVMALIGRPSMLVNTRI